MAFRCAAWVLGLALNSNDSRVQVFTSLAGMWCVQLLNANLKINESFSRYYRMRGHSLICSGQFSHNATLQIMRLQIDPKNFPSTDAAVAGIIGDMKARRSGKAGYCVAYDCDEDTNFESKRVCVGLESAIHDLASWGRIHSETIELFTNGNYCIAAKLTKKG